MSNNNIVHVVGTGTIGSVLTGLFARYKDKLGIDEVTFHKNRAFSHDMPMVQQLIEFKASLSTDEDKFDKFKELGVSPVFTRSEAIERANVIIDCTPKGVGLQNKREYYDKYHNKTRLFCGQGSETGFGKIFAKGINENALSDDDYFVQIASCNTHSIAVILKSLQGFGKIIDSNFVCIRRSNDISQDFGMTPSIEVSSIKHSRFGTHHAYDAHSLFQTLGEDLNIYSNACKIATQYMHAINFNIRIKTNNEINDADILNSFDKNKYISMTEKTSANKIFSWFRDFGTWGRTLTQVVISVPSFQVRDMGDGEYCVSAFLYTPQDSNSLLSSLAVALWFLNDKDWGIANQKISCFDPYLFQRL